MQFLELERREESYLGVNRHYHRQSAITFHFESRGDVSGVHMLHSQSCGTHANYEDGIINMP